ncbi:MAG: hypothetical protein WCR79_07090 [Fusobacterium sp.]
MLFLKIKNTIHNPYEGYSWLALGIYGLGVLIAVSIGAVILANKKASKKFEEAIYENGIGNEIKLDENKD